MVCEYFDNAGDSLEPCRLSESLRVPEGAGVQEVHVLEPRFWFFSKSFPQDLVISPIGKISSDDFAASEPLR